MKYDKFSKLDLLLAVFIFFYPLISEFITIKFNNSSLPYVISETLHLSFLTSLTLLLTRALFFLYFLAPSAAFLFGVVILMPSFYFRIVEPEVYLNFVKDFGVLKNIAILGFIYILSTFLKDKCISASRNQDKVNLWN